MKESPPLNEIIEIIRKEQDLDSVIGLICLNYIIINSSVDDILLFIERKSIKIPIKKVYTRLELLRHICLHYYEQFNTNEQIQDLYDNCLDYIGF